MKKLLSILASLVIICNFSISSLAATDNPAYGRLVISSVNIDVALYNSNSQSVCDAEDSACFYYLGSNQGMTIADHSSQTFETLTMVTVGDTAVIKESNGGRIYLQCIEVVDGRNEGDYLVYSDGSIATGRSDYLTYTCLDTKGNIRICQWDIVNVENIDSGYENQFNIDTRTRNKVVYKYGLCQRVAMLLAKCEFAS